MLTISDPKVSLFGQLFLEAPEDDIPPDIEAPADAPATEEAAPDDTPPEEGIPTDDAPPDIDAEATEDMFGSDDTATEEQPKEDITVSEKISNIMNRGLFQKFISLLNTIELQISTIKSNSDVLFSLSEKCIQVMKGLEKLNDNIRLYLSNQFEDTNYSENLFFYHKCSNLLSLLNDDLDKAVSGSVSHGGGETSK